MAINSSFGLSSAAAAAELARHGYNELPAKENKSFWRLSLEILFEPMILLLIICSLLYLFLGNHSEAILLVSSVAFVVAISLYQQNKTEKALKALRQLASPKALVIRDGRQQFIPGREVVVGDLLILNEGDRIPADASLVEATNLEVDESILTGEAAPVAKDGLAGADSLTGQHQIYSGTLVVRGHALAQVTAIGINSEIGRIGLSLSSLKSEPARLEKETARLVRYFALIGLAACLLVFFGLWRHTGDVIASLLAGLTLAMGILPEEFPVVMTVFMALGAWRLSQRNVLVRRLSAIESLGSTTVLCTDKTGTLTQNQMAVAALAVADGDLIYNGQINNPLPEKFHLLLDKAVLASSQEPFEPLEKAIRQLAVANGRLDQKIFKEAALLREYPLSSELFVMSRVWSDGDHKIVAAKGAPEALLKLCHLDSAVAAVWQRRLEEMAARGWRVIGVAQAALSGGQLPERQADFEFSFLGLVALTDPLRPETKTAVEECHQAGIRVVMITGDYPVTAANIARQLGLAWQKVVSGPELAAMDQATIQTVLSTTDVFARVTPEQKLLLVEALKAERQIVAMTGDGVNDAPALKAAHIGIAMGQRGTDVAREAASIVLLDDRFVSIVSGMKLGRRIYDNLQKAVGYLISVHLPIIALSLVPVFFGSPLILLPAHIVFLELIIDPTCSIVFEMEKSDLDLMNRPPRSWSAKLFNWRLLAPHLFSGLVAAAVIFVPYYHYLRVGTPEQARLVAFGSLILINIFLIFSSRFRRRNYRSLLANRAAWLVSAGALSLLVAVIFIPLTAHLFGFSQFQTSFLPWMFGAALTVALFSIIFQRLAEKRE